MVNTWFKKIQSEDHRNRGGLSDEQYEEFRKVLADYKSVQEQRKQEVQAMELARLKLRHT